MARIRDLKEIKIEDFPDVVYLTVGGWETPQLSLTMDNLLYLIERHNELIRTLKERLAK